jgi:hypothetical protein
VHDRMSDDEQGRLAALDRYEILDTEPQEAFDAAYQDDIADADRSREHG